MQILLTGLHTFYSVLFERTCLIIETICFCDHFFNSHDLPVLQCTDVMRRNSMPIIIGA